MANAMPPIRQRASSSGDVGGIRRALGAVSASESELCSGRHIEGSANGDEGGGSMSVSVGEVGGEASTGDVGHSQSR